MTHAFDKDYWQQHWREWRDGEPGDPGSMSSNPPNPYLASELGDLAPGTALDAGCGGGAEAIWLATAGWQVTAADISAVALASAAQRAESGGATERLQWVEADLSTWDPGTQFDLVTTHYAHPAMPQLDFYARLAAWVAPGGTLLIVGHLYTHKDHGDEHGHGHHPPAEASATPAAITARLHDTDDADDTRWEIVTAEDRQRSVPGRGGRESPLHDVVVRATRLQP